jgi:hypothetical protein
MDVAGDLGCGEEWLKRLNFVSHDGKIDQSM